MNKFERNVFTYKNHDFSTEFISVQPKLGGIYENLKLRWRKGVAEFCFRDKKHVDISFKLSGKQIKLVS